MEDATVLIVDDEPAARFAMRRAIQETCRIVEARDVDEARVQLERERPEVILLDHGLPGCSGLEWLQELGDSDPSPAVIMVTAHGSERIAVEAMKAGAYDYLTKPYGVDELRICVRRAIERQALRRGLSLLQDQLAGEGAFGSLVAVSACMQELFQTAGRVARSDLPVLLLGESGTGKDLFAREIHARSRRSAGPFVPLNCAALPEHLVESELFGYEKGAFTNAVAAHPGRFEQANRGTLFLDEIGEMAPGTQSKILRAVESGCVERLGSSRSVPINVRIVSATNRNLDAAVAAARFRQDLYYRLAGVTLSIPPLRERPEDIPPVAAACWRELRQRYGTPGPEMTPEAARQLQSLPWPGNVRQLKSTLEKLFILAPQERLTAPAVAQAVDNTGAPSAPEDSCFACGGLREARRRFEIEFLTRKLRACGGNVTRTASAIGMARQSLQEKLKELGLSKPAPGDNSQEESA